MRALRRDTSSWAFAVGAGRETTIFSLVALAVVGLGNSNISTGDGKTPRPQTTA
ncbi:hypothetical protein [Streptomyces sp. NPDC047065]|uniref:hypothetical protein n=1 Tax=Streptomyces sp. NPDC047065 TaxID=3154606 RepID=UPI0033E10387